MDFFIGREFGVRSSLVEGGVENCMAQLSNKLVGCHNTMTIIPNCIGAYMQMCLNIKVPKCIGA